MNVEEKVTQYCAKPFTIQFSVTFGAKIERSDDILKVFEISPGYLLYRTYSLWPSCHLRYMKTKRKLRHTDKHHHIFKQSYVHSERHADCKSQERKKEGGRENLSYLRKSQMNL